MAKKSKKAKKKTKKAAVKARKAPARKAKTAKKATKKKAAKKVVKAAAKKVPAKKAAAKKPAPKKAAKPAPKQKIIGEGDYEASRSFLKDQAGFVKKNRSRIPEMGKAAEMALEGPEGAALKAAEAEAASHSKAGGAE